MTKRRNITKYILRDACGDGPIRAGQQLGKKKKQECKQSSQGLLWTEREDTGGMQAEERIWRETEGGKCKEAEMNNKTMKPISQGHTRGNKERKRRGQGGGERKPRQNEAWRVRDRGRG